MPGLFLFILTLTFISSVTKYSCVHCRTACASQAEQEAAECTAVSVIMREKTFLVWTKNCLISSSFLYNVEMVSFAKGFI